MKYLQPITVLYQGAFKFIHYEVTHIFMLFNSFYCQIIRKVESLRLPQ